MKVPKWFYLFATKIEVVYDSQLCDHKHQYGQASYGESKITLTKTDHTAKLSEGKILDTFYHEKIHIILETMNEYELSKNEKFVDVFAKLLRQSDETSVYENS
jgi:hypothetical protein